MKKGILIIVAILLMILAVFPIVDYFMTKHLIYDKGQLTDTTDIDIIVVNYQTSLGVDNQETQNFFYYFSLTYQPLTDGTIVNTALHNIININGNEIMNEDTDNIVPYISYLVDLFLIWFILFAILQVPVFTMRLMGLDKDKGGKRL